MAIQIRVNPETQKPEFTATGSYLDPEKGANPDWGKQWTEITDMKEFTIMLSTMILSGIENRPKAHVDLKQKLKAESNPEGIEGVVGKKPPVVILEKVVITQADQTTAQQLLNATAKNLGVAPTAIKFVDPPVEETEYYQQGIETAQQGLANPGDLGSAFDAGYDMESMSKVLPSPIVDPDNAGTVAVLGGSTLAKKIAALQDEADQAAFK